MNRKSKLWLTAASLFSLLNAAGGGYAVALAEGPHAGLHVVLMFLGMYASWRIVARAGGESHSGEGLGDDRLDHIQQAVDAVAVEVERIGEAQRFSAKLQQERVETGG